MKLIKLSVKNIASYKFAELDFESLEYPVVVYGDNGAGKTTLFVDSITAALFAAAYGSPKLYKNLRGRVGYGEIILEFTVNNDKYRVVRRIHTDKPSEAYLYIYSNGEYVPISPTKTVVDNKIKEITGLSHEELLYSAVIRQGEVEALIEADDSERAKILINILKLNLEVAEKRAHDKIKSLNTEVKVLQERVRGIDEVLAEEEKFKSTLAILTEEEGKLATNQNKLEEELFKLNRKFEELNSELSKLRRVEGEYKGAIESYERLSNRLAELNKKLLNQMEAISKLGLDERSIMLISENLDDIIDYYNRSIDIKEECNKLRKAEEYINNLKTLNREKKIIEEKFKLLKIEIEKLTNNKARIDVNLAGFHENINKLKQAKTSCPICGSPLSKEHKKHRLRVFEEEISRLRREEDEINNRLAKMKKEYENFENTLNKINGEIKGIMKGLELLGIVDIENDIVKLKRDIEELRNVLGNLENKIKSINRLNINNLGTIIKYKNNFRVFYELKLQVNNIQSELKVYERKAVEYPVIRRKIDNINRELKHITGKIGNIQENLEKTKRRRSEIKGRIIEIKRRINEIQKLKDEKREVLAKLEELEIEREAYEILKEVFSWRGLPLSLLKHHLEIINRLTNQYIELFTLPLTMKLIVGMRGGKPTVTLKTYREGLETDHRTLSNGERVLIGFAIRLAVNDLISSAFYVDKRPRFFIVDEGFGPLDSENRRRVAWALYKLLKERKFDQMIVISHAEGLWEEEIFKTRIEIYKEAGVSNINIRS